ncbi:MAG TPA: hypothetical protein VGH95_01605 [Candidatus Aquirickettsiella sp.]|jgi:hypothetical protein
MTTETEDSALIIQKIKKQKGKIIDEIFKRERSENLHLIESWIKQIDPESPFINISLVAITIDTIFFHFKNEINKENNSLIESCLFSLINKLSKQANVDEISVIVSNLKAYIKTNDNDDKYELEKFIGKLASSTNRFSLIRDISKQPILFYKKIESNCSNIFKTQLNNIPIAVLTAESSKKCQISFEGVANSGGFTNNSSKNKEQNSHEKIRTRIINFDENGKGYVVNKIKRETKKNCSLCEVKSIQKSKLYYPYKNESQFTKDIREAFFFINFLRENKINYNYEKNIKSIFQSYALEEFKAVICKRIYDFKLQNSKIFYDAHNKTNIFLLPNFLDINSEYRDNFLLLINFSILEKLAKKADIIANNINTLMPILDDISDLCFEWNVNPEFSKFYKVKNSFNAKFNNNTFVRYLEYVFFLFEENKLKFDKICPNFYCEVSKLTLKNVSENRKMEINKLKSDLSVNRFLKKQQEAIQCYFDKHLQINLDNFQTNASFSVFKLFLIKICEFILNLFNINFFISNINNLYFFSSKYDLFDLELDCVSLDRIYNEFTLKLNWLEFLKSGINPFFLASISFKKNLSEKLFLYIVNRKFLHAIKYNFSVESFSNNRRKLANDLLLIRLSLENAKIGTINDLICFYEKNNINLEKIGEPIIKLLNENKAFKEYLEAMDTLIQNNQSLNKEFSILCNTTQENIVKLGETQMNDRFSQYVSKGNYLFKLPQTNQSNSRSDYTKSKITTISI